MPKFELLSLLCRQSNFPIDGEQWLRTQLPGFLCFMLTPPALHGEKCSSQQQRSSVYGLLNWLYSGNSHTWNDWKVLRQYQPVVLTSRHPCQETKRHHIGTLCFPSIACCALAFTQIGLFIEKFGMLPNFIAIVEYLVDRPIRFHKITQPAKKACSLQLE